MSILSKLRATSAVRLAGASAIALAWAGTGLAQEFDADAEPNYGTHELSGNDGEMAVEFKLISGGSVAAEYGADEMCSGFATSQPDVVIDFDPDGSEFLRFYAVSGGDLTLVVSDPDGNWLCDDDGFNNLNPKIDIDEPEAGEYAVWVASYDSFDRLGATLGVTDSSTGTIGGALDPDAEPAYQTVTLAPGFPEDPTQVSLDAGGPIDADAATGGWCSGYVAAVPDVTLVWDDEDVDFLRIFAESDTDTTLVIRDPDGEWLCDDDGHYATNPRVDIVDGVGGEYDIWVGSYYQGESESALLSITELELVSTTDNLDWDSDAEYGDYDFASDAEDALSIDLTAGGDVDLDAAIGNDFCYGFVDAAADIRLQWDGDDDTLLAFRVKSDGDTVLAVNDANGEWHCNDDSLEDVNAEIMLPGAPSGQYDIWVGAFSESDLIDAALKISAGDEMAQEAEEDGDDEE